MIVKGILRINHIYKKRKDFLLKKITILNHVQLKTYRNIRNLIIKYKVF